MLKILTQNIWGMNNHWQQRADAIGQAMEAQAVDVLCIQESSPEHFEYLHTNSFKAWPHAVYASSDDATITPGKQGLAMFSTHPIILSGTYDLGREDHPKIDPWMRIIHHIQIQLESTVTIFNTHLFLNQAQKRQGIAGCVQHMNDDAFKDSLRILAGDFNIRFEDSGNLNLLEPLINAGFADVWQVYRQDEPGLTWPLDHKRPLAYRLDGQFIETAYLDSVRKIDLANHMPVYDGSLYLSDHIGVLGEYTTDTI